MQSHFDRIEANEIQKVLEIGSRLSALILDAQALAKSPHLPVELRKALDEFVGHCDDTMTDCCLSSAVDRYEGAEPARERGRIAYDREMGRAAE